MVAAAIEAGSLFAHAVNTVKMAEGFARLGHKVIMLCLAPAGGPCPPERLAALYGLSEQLHWMQLPPTINGHPRGDGIGFALPALRAARREGVGLIYARNYLLPAAAARLGLRAMAESHAAPSLDRSDFTTLLSATGLPAFKGLVTIAPVLAQGYGARGADPARIWVLPDAVDDRLFARPRRLPPSPYGAGPNAVYAGHLYDYKGIPAILDAAALLPSVRFHLVGGLPADIDRVGNQISARGLANVQLHGQQRHADIPAYLWHADLALLPPSAQHPSAAWTSPMKLGEYMMAGVPMVVTDIPALRNWLTEAEVLFCAPDDGPALAGAILELLRDGPTRAARVAASLDRVKDWTFARRAAKVLEVAGIDPAAPGNKPGGDA